jgi:hypothetical protein
MMEAVPFLGYQDWGLKEIGVRMASELALTWICCPDWYFEKMLTMELGERKAVSIV